MLEKLEQFHCSVHSSKVLAVVLGLLADFDSIEYVQELINILPKLTENHIKLIVIGIGDDLSKEKFCSYTKLPKELIIVDKDSSLHQSLELSKGLDLHMGSWLDMLLMCAGVSSPATLPEVLRGYLGDRNASSRIKPDELIRIWPFPEFRGSLFSLAGGENYLRPFELATIRLKNMIEIIGNWDLYVTDHKLLTQRGGTFLIDSDCRLLYSYRPKSLLSYSPTMSRPLSFLEPWIG